MTIPEDRLTAFALNDPGLTDAERADAEAAVAADPAARAEVEATRQLAAALATALTREQAALTADVPLTVAAKPVRRWPAYAAGLASGLAVALAVAVLPTLADRKPPSENVTAVAKESPNLTHVDGGMDSEGKPEVLQKVFGAGPGGEARPAVPGNVTVTPLEAMGAITLGGPGDTEFKDAQKGLASGGGRAGPPAAMSPPIPPASGPSSAPRPVVPTPGVGAPATAGPGASPPAGGSSSPGGMPGGLGGYPGSAGGPTGGFGGGQGGFSGGGFGRTGTPGRPAIVPGVTGPVAAAAKPREAKAGEWDTRGIGGFDEAKLTDSIAPKPRYVVPPEQPDQQRYSQLVENRFVAVEGQAALSTFGVDVDTASYSIIRNYLMAQNSLPPASAVRLEEVVNYFPYQDKPPTGDDPFAVTVEVAQCPWAPGHRLARIGVKAKPIDKDKRPPSNLVFLVDVSGSMSGPNRLPLVKSSLKQLVGQLGENDRVAMVAYAGASGVVLDSTSATKKDVIVAALDRLESGGSTNGSGGIQDAYTVAAANFIKGGTNRVIVCTDGDWNVGTTGTDQLVQLIEEKKKTGVFLSVFGFGMGNLRDEMMVKLAGKGNGNYAYIDTEREAHKAMVEQLSGTIVTVAKDVKIQVEFNPAAVSSYRLLGYEKRHLNAEDFHNDAKDAGEMGAGHTVTALYELVPVGGAAEQPGTELKYQKAVAAAQPVAAEAFTVKMRHKKPDADVSTYRELSVKNEAKAFGQASEDFRFSAAAAGYALLLRNSEFKGNATFAAVLDWAAGAMTFDPSGYRAEFLELARKAQALSGK